MCAKARRVGGFCKHHARACPAKSPHSEISGFSNDHERPQVQVFMDTVYYKKIRVLLKLLNTGIKEGLIKKIANEQILELEIKILNSAQRGPAWGKNAIPEGKNA